MSKPALADLIKQTTPKRKKKASAASPPAKTVELRSSTLVETFVTEYIRCGFKAGPAYKQARGSDRMNPTTASASACRLLGRDDVQAELQRQLKPIVVDRKLNQQWVLEQWAAMANANIVDYMEFDAAGKFLGFKIDPAKLTVEQQQNIQGARVDPKTGKLVHLQLVSRPDTVDKVARANKMYRETEAEEAVADFVKEITDRMQRASKMLPRPRTFDGETGEEIE